MNFGEFNTTVGNWLSAAAVLGTLAGWLPPLAALIAAVWYCIQIYESDTFQSWMERRRAKHVAYLEAKIAKLKNPKSNSPN